MSFPLAAKRRLDHFFLLTKNLGLNLSIGVQPIEFFLSHAFLHPFRCWERMECSLMVASLRLAKVGGSFNLRILFRLETSDSSSSSQEQPDRYVHFHELSRQRCSFRKVLSMHIRQSDCNRGIFLPYFAVSSLQSINNGFIPLVDSHKASPTVSLLHFYIPPAALKPPRTAGFRLPVLSSAIFCFSWLL